MPVAGVAFSKGPYYICVRKASIDVGVFRYVIVVVEIDKFVIFYRPIGDESCHRQGKAN